MILDILMKKKLMITSIFLVILIISGYSLPSLTIKISASATPTNAKNECNICPITSPSCIEWYPLICISTYFMLKNVDRYYRSKIMFLKEIYRSIAIVFWYISGTLIEERGLQLDSEDHWGYGTLAKYCIWNINDFENIPWD